MTKATLATLFAATATLAGCTSSAPPPPADNAIRSASQTAPADLQLLCASETAARLGIDSGSVFPVSSVSAAGGYQVNLNTGGGQAVCTIDDNGNVLSVNQV
jgi:hypothetical protein